MPGNQRRRIYLAIVAFVILAIVGFYIAAKKRTPIPAQPSVNPPAVSKPSAAALPIQKHVLIVLEENTSYKDVIGNAKDMPYLNSIASDYAYAKNYFASTHPSIGNYFMLTTGQIITNNGSSSKEVTDDNIVRQLIAAGKTWKEYSENLPSVGYTGGDKNGYTEHHNPLSYFSDVRSNSDQAKNLVPFSQFAADLASNQLPDFAFIAPNEINDAHSCPSSGTCNKLATADAWLKTNLDPLIRNSDFNQPGGGILIVTFDESAKSDKTHGGGPVAWVAAGADVKKGYVSDTFYQHENTLRFMSELLGLKSFPGKAASAANMGEFLK